VSTLFFYSIIAIVEPFVSQVTTPTLPSPFPEGGIYDKGEGLGGGEK